MLLERLSEPLLTSTNATTPSWQTQEILYLAVFIDNYKCSLPVNMDFQHSGKNSGSLRRDKGVRSVSISSRLFLNIKDSQT